MMKDRDYLFDNLKAVLIFNVALVHFMAAVRSEVGVNQTADLIMLVICSFHMPLFMFISGFFSKRTNEKGLANLLIVYLTVSVLFLLYDCLTGASLADRSVIDFISPGFSMWFLFALILYKLFLPVLLKIKNKKCLLIFLLILSVLTMGSSMSGAIEKPVVKTLANAVFFMLGVYFDNERIESIRKRPKWIYFTGFLAGSLCLILITAVFQFISPNLLRLMMLRAKTVSGAGFGGFGYIIYLFIVLFAVYMSVMLIGFFPSNKTVFSVYGKNSLTVYIGQAFVYLLFRKILSEIPGITIVAGYITAFILAFAVTFIMGSELVYSSFRKFISFIQNKIFSE